jgi:hypothetical protein
MYIYMLVTKDIVMSYFILGYLKSLEPLNLIIKKGEIKMNNNCCCSLPTLIILILIVLQFSKKRHDEDYHEEHHEENPFTDNGILFIIALFFLSCAGCGGRCNREY